MLCQPVIYGGLPTPLIPAQAGIQSHKFGTVALGPRFRGDERPKLARAALKSASGTMTCVVFARHC